MLYTEVTIYPYRYPYTLPSLTILLCVVKNGSFSSCKVHDLGQALANFRGFRGLSSTRVALQLKQGTFHGYAMHRPTETQVCGISQLHTKYAVEYCREAEAGISG